jgi:hypothetical protein
MGEFPSHKSRSDENPINAKSKVSRRAGGLKSCEEIARRTQAAANPEKAERPARIVRAGRSILRILSHLPCSESPRH